MAKESRFAEIYRQQLMKDKGIFGAFASTASERAKERADLRRLLPKSGITGAISQRIFGKPYRAGTTSDRGESARITRVDMNSQVTARNTSVLPAMAREMNLTRLNMQKLVKLAGGTPSRTSTLKDTSLKKESSSTIGKTIGSVGSAAGGILGGLFSALGGLGGGLISIGGSLLSGVVGLLGSVGGAVFKVIGGGLSMLGPLGIVLSAASAFIIYKLSQSLDFDKLKKDFEKIYNDVTTGIMNFFGLSGDEGAPSITEQFALKLNDFFGTEKFTDTLDFVEDSFREMVGTISDEGQAAFQGFVMLIEGLAKDIKGFLENTYEQIRPYLIGAAAALTANKLLNYSPPGMLQGVPGAPGNASGVGVPGTPGTPGLKSNIISQLKSAGKEAVITAGTGLLGFLYGKATNEYTREELDKKIIEVEKQIGEIEKSGVKNVIDAEDLRRAKEKLQQLKIRDEILKGREGNVGRALSEYQRLRQGTIDSGIIERRFEDDPVTGLKRLRSETRSERRQKYQEEIPSRSPSKLNQDQGQIADLIYTRFREAGFSDAQAKGAIANAIAESGLNPNAYNKTDREESVGLFQMNRMGGLGKGYSVEQLKDVETNIALAIKEAKNSTNKNAIAFRNATTAEEATQAFMKGIMRPYDQSESAQSKRIQNLAKFEGKKFEEPNKDKTDIFDNMLAMISGVIGLITETNKNIQGVAQTVAASSAGSEQNSNVIASPYDMELREMLLQFHSDIATPLGS